MKTIKGWFVTIVSLSVLFGFASSVQATSATVVKSQVGITFLEGDPTEESAGETTETSTGETTGESTETGKETTKPSASKDKGKLPQTGEADGVWGSLLGILFLILAVILLCVRRVLVKRAHNQ